MRTFILDIPFDPILFNLFARAPIQEKD